MLQRIRRCAVDHAVGQSATWGSAPGGPPRGEASRVRARLALALVLAAVTIAVAAAPSSATLPGKNGRIAFDGVVPGTCCSEIFTAKPNGTAVHRLTSTPGRRDSELPEWSPDGQRIAFDTRLEFDEAQIYVMNAEGSNITQLTSGPGVQRAAGWSPDAGSLAIAADWGHPRALQGIWIIPSSDPDGVTQEDARRLTVLPAGFGSDSEPQFSPDGSSLVFTRFKNLSRSAILRINLDGTGLERLTPWRLNASDPDWSSDGQRIVFDSGDSGAPGSKGNIYVMRADGSGRTRLTDRGPVKEDQGIRGVNNPVWSPSGTRIMYTRYRSHEPPSNGNMLVAMNADGSGKHPVVSTRFGKRHYPDKVDWGTHP
jgi:Tol biopolymer transport system component